MKEDRAENAEKAGKIVAEIISMKKGLKVMEGVSFIRINSRTFNLLIMEDYMPVIGEVEGMVTLVNREEEYRMEHVSGFFCHSKNHFAFMMQEETL